MIDHDHRRRADERGRSATLSPKPPPYSLESEQAVLGGMLLDAEALSRGIAALSPDSFHVTTHKRIFTAMSAMHRQGERLTYPLLASWLEEAGWLDEVGGRDYLRGLVGAAFAPAIFDEHVDVVVRYSMKREVADLLADLLDRAQDGVPADALIGEAREEIERLDRKVSAVIGSAEQAVTLEALLADTSPPPSPLVEGLVWPQTITLLAGETKKGKTQLILQLGRAVVGGQPFLGLAVPAPAPVLYIGQEDAMWALRERMRGIHPRFELAKAAFHLLSAKGLLLEGGGVRRLVARHHPGVVILDPLRRFHTREEEKGEMGLVMREMDLLVRDFACAVVVVHHMRKPKEDRRRRPEIADVRGNSVITDQANTIALLAEDEDPATFTLRITGNYTEHHTIRLQRVGWVFERRGPNEGLAVAEAVAAFADKGPLPRAEAVRVLLGRGLSRASAYRRVEEMQRSGWLLAGEDGRLALNETLLNAGPGTRPGVSFTA